MTKKHEFICFFCKLLQASFFQMPILLFSNIQLTAKEIDEIEDIVHVLENDDAQDPEEKENFAEKGNLYYEIFKHPENYIQ